MVFTIGCKKHSSISGTVTSSADGKPLEGATVVMTFINGKKGGGTELVARESQLTDEKGQYALEACTPDAGASIGVSKGGYARKFSVPFTPGDCKEIDFVLHPYDAWLSLSVENTSGTRIRKFYYNYTGPFLDNDDLCFSTCPYTLKPLEIKTAVARIPGGSDILFRWDTVSTSGQPLKKIIVACKRNDTTYINIKI